MSNELNVKVGDEVLYRHSSIYSKDEEIAIVKKVTPTGRIRIDKSINQFDKYGMQMGDTGRGRDYICILTDDKKKEIIRRDEIRKCIHTFDNLKNKITYEQAKGILDILLERK